MQRWLYLPARARGSTGGKRGRWGPKKSQEGVKTPGGYAPRHDAQPSAVRGAPSAFRAVRASALSAQRHRNSKWRLLSGIAVNSRVPLAYTLVTPRQLNDMSPPATVTPSASQHASPRYREGGLPTVDEERKASFVRYASAGVGDASSPLVIKLYG